MFAAVLLALHPWPHQPCLPCLPFSPMRRHTSCPTSSRPSAPPSPPPPFSRRQVEVLGLPWEYTAGDVRGLIQAAVEGEVPGIGPAINSVEVVYREDGKSEVRGRGGGVLCVGWGGGRRKGSRCRCRGRQGIKVWMEDQVDSIN